MLISVIISILLWHQYLKTEKKHHWCKNVIWNNSGDLQQHKSTLFLVFFFPLLKNASSFTFNMATCCSYKHIRNVCWKWEPFDQANYLTENIALGFDGLPSTMTADTAYPEGNSPSAYSHSPKRLAQPRLVAGHHPKCAENCKNTQNRILITLWILNDSYL